jgi:hypothetical protein
MVKVDDKEIRVYPMKLKDKDKVIGLVEKFNDNIIFTNFMSPKYDMVEVDGTTLPMPVRDDKGSIVYDDAPFNAMVEMLQLATKQTKKEVLEWADVYNTEEIVTMFLNISQLKKKMREQEEEN